MFQPVIASDAVDDVTAEVMEADGEVENAGDVKEAE